MSINDRIAATYKGFAVLIAAVVVMLTWWQVIEAPSLRDREFNQQYQYYEQRIERGVIHARGRELAISVPETGPDGDRIWKRRYPEGSVTAHVVGYSTTGRSRVGLERSFNDVLTRANERLAEIIDIVQGQDDQPGDSLNLTLRYPAQALAMRELGDRRGAAVALDPRTGAILVMASTPSYDPNAVEGDDFAAIAKREDAPLLNRATQAGYVPGSTFKLVTATAALEEEIAEPDSNFPGGCEYETSGPPVQNFGGACFGSHTLETALEKSINTTFAELGDEVGIDAMREYMGRFGFNEPPALRDLAGEEQRVSGLVGDDGKILEESDNDVVDEARLGIGQDRLQVTPLQMAQVVATIANDGLRMRPYLVAAVQDADRSPRDTTEPDELDRVMSEQTAAQLTAMMTKVVAGGTGAAAAIPGIDVAGKTGTADTPQGNQVWFVAFAPADAPKVAVVVTLEGQATGITGGGAAAPIARSIMSELLGAAEL